MPLPRLVLYPISHSDTRIDPALLKKELENIGLIQAQVNEGTTYLPADNFLKLLTFLGCSPHINLRPDDGENYCHISIGKLSTDVVCLGYTASVKPKCPQCKSVIQDWKKTRQWQDGSSIINCRKCATATPLKELKWRQEAGYGVFSIMIYNIHPHEAVPAEALLLHLEKTTGSHWDYFYANNSE